MQHHIGLIPIPAGVEAEGEGVVAGGSGGAGEGGGGGVEGHAGRECAVGGPSDCCGRGGRVKGEAGVGLVQRGIRERAVDGDLRAEIASEAEAKAEYAAVRVVAAVAKCDPAEGLNIEIAAAAEATGGGIWIIHIPAPLPRIPAHVMNAQLVCRFRSYGFCSITAVVIIN